MKRVLSGVLFLLLIICLVGCSKKIEVSSENGATDQLLKAQSELATIEKQIEENDKIPLKIEQVDKSLTQIKERIDNSEPYTISENVKERYDTTLSYYEKVLVKYNKLKAEREE